MTHPSPTVTPKVVLITGASSGIGEATARRLAAAGHHVVLGARRTDRLAALTKDIEAEGGSAMALELDVTDPASVNAFVATAHDRHGRVDVLVNNAGAATPRIGGFASVSDDDWLATLTLNLHEIGSCTFFDLVTFYGTGFLNSSTKKQ